MAITRPWQSIKSGYPPSPPGFLPMSISYLVPTWQCRQLGSSSTGHFPGRGRSQLGELAGQSILSSLSCHFPFCLNLHPYFPTHSPDDIVLPRLENDGQQRHSSEGSLFSALQVSLRQLRSAHGSRSRPGPLEQSEKASSRRIQAVAMRVRSLWLDLTISTTGHSWTLCQKGQLA